MNIEYYIPPLFGNYIIYIEVYIYYIIPGTQRSDTHCARSYFSQAILINIIHPITTGFCATHIIELQQLQHDCSACYS